jgi:transcriptional regulator with XRE-family HTH domain
MADAKERETVGDRIKRFRQERGIKLTELAERAEISKGYLSSIEAGEGKRPSDEVLYRVADQLGVTINDLLGRRMLTETPGSSKALEEFAAKHNLPEADIKMLASIQFRGEQPRTVERWEHIYSAIRGSRWIDEQAE